MDDRLLRQTVIGCALRVHSGLGPGFLESVYQKAMVHELIKAGVQVETGKLLPVFYDGLIVGEFCPDLIINASL